MVRVAARLDEGAHSAGRLSLAEQDAVHATAEQLPELPGIEAHVRLVGAVDRRFHDDRGRPVSALHRSTVDQATHVLGKSGQVKGAVLHADVDVVCPGMGILPALLMRQHMPGMPAGVVDRLVLRQQVDRPIHA